MLASPSALRLTAYHQSHLPCRGVPGAVYRGQHRRERAGSSSWPRWPRPFPARMGGRPGRTRSPRVSPRSSARRPARPPGPLAPAQGGEQPRGGRHGHRGGQPQDQLAAACQPDQQPHEQVVQPGTASIRPSKRSNWGRDRCAADSVAPSSRQNEGPLIRHSVTARVVSAMQAGISQAGISPAGAGGAGARPGECAGGAVTGSGARTGAASNCVASGARSPTQSRLELSQLWLMRFPVRFCTIQTGRRGSAETPS